MSLVFHPRAHVYELDGADVPSVTGILKASGLIDFTHIPPSVLAAALDRGTQVHAAIHFFNERDLDVGRFDREFPDYAGYLHAWIAFTEQRHFVPVLNEHRIASRRHQIAGTLDCLGALDGVGALLDFATGRPQDVSKDLQTAAYLGLAHEWAAEPDADPALVQFVARYPVVRRFAVALRRDATFRLEAYADPTDFRKFLTLAEAQRIVAARRGEIAA